MSVRRIASLLAVSVAAIAVPVLATPGIDAQGGFQHVLTLHPARTMRPVPIKGPVRVFAYAADPTGGALLVGEGEYLAFDGHGRLDRSRFQHADVPYPTFGNALSDGDRFDYCDATGKAIARLDDRGRRLQRTTPAGLDVGHVCQLYRDGAGGMTAIQGFPYFGWRIDAKGRTAEKFAFEFPLRKPATALRPCGVEPGGNAIGAEARDGHDLALVRLGPGLLPGATLWSYDDAADPLGKIIKSLRLGSAQGCGYGAGRAVFWMHNQVLVFHGPSLEAWHRGSDKLDPNNPHVMSGLGPYASQILGYVQVMGTEAQPILLVAERDQGEIKLFAPPPKFAAEDARKAAITAMKAGEPVQAEQAWASWLTLHADDADAQVQQVANRLAAGWWEEAVALAQERLNTLAPGSDTARRLEQVRARARALLLVRWALRTVSPHAGPMPGQPDPLLAYVAETEQLVLAAPDMPEVHLAAARLHRMAGHRAAFLQHLEPLAAMLKAGRLRASDVPELFDLMAARGDVDGMTRFLSALPKDAPNEDVVRWTGTLLRAQGRFDDALRAVGDPVAPRLLALRAAIQVDAGDVQGGILTWTRALQAGLEGDAAAQSGLGLAYLRRGLAELAVQALNKAVGLDADDLAARSNLAAAYGALDRRDDALQQLFGALAKQPKDPLLRWQLTQASAPPQVPTVSGPAATVAVLPFATAGGANQRVGLGEFVAVLLTTAVVEGGGPPVVERARLDAVLQEQKLGRTAWVDHATAVKTGKLLGVQQIVMGNAAEFDGAVALDVRLVDARTGKVLAAAHARSRLDLDDLRSATQQLAKELLPKPTR